MLVLQDEVCPSPNETSSSPGPPPLTSRPGIYRDGLCLCRVQDERKNKTVIIFLMRRRRYIPTAAAQSCEPYRPSRCLDHMSVARKKRESSHTPALGYVGAVVLSRRKMDPAALLLAFPSADQAHGVDTGCAYHETGVKPAHPETFPGKPGRVKASPAR
jgi:hypothetical protein